MAATLRQLLIQRAARLQERPAVTAPDWGTLSWGAWRNRVEGVALGLMAEPCPLGTVLQAEGDGPWPWAAEVAAACCGLAWGEGAPVPPDVLGGPAFNADAGRGPYHDREEAVQADLPFTAGLTQGDLMLRLQRWNARLGWDHQTEIRLPPAAAASPAGRAALWCALYAGAHARFLEPAPPRVRWFQKAPAAPLDLGPFEGFWSP